MLPMGGLGHWVGGAAYARVQALSWLWTAARLEARAKDHLIVKLEGRYDHSDQPVFDAHGFNPLTALPAKTNQQGLVVLGAVATF
jgi:hypothetical protein